MASYKESGQVPLEPSKPVLFNRRQFCRQGTSSDVMTGVRAVRGAVQHPTMHRASPSQAICWLQTSPVLRGETLL
jgi:hypothetical protein